MYSLDSGTNLTIVFLGPLSEFYGRKPVYIVSYFFFLSRLSLSGIAVNNSMANPHCFGTKHHNYNCNSISRRLLRSCLPFRFRRLNHRYVDQGTSFLANGDIYAWSVSGTNNWSSRWRIYKSTCRLEMDLLCHSHLGWC